ncbi:phage tail protein [Herbaspirillum chlorophenolicum]|uniref:Phage tail protein n=1 Tax=Herbaspirillum chlorophenolicum TaxID=211589 RepID=A0ABW8F140_9BURK
MSTFFATLTKVGEAKLANALALGQTLKFKQMGVGDANGQNPTPSPTQTALIHEVRRADLNQLSKDASNSSQIILEQVLPESVGGWWVREIGAYDADGDLCAVANCPPSYKPLTTEGSGRVQTIRMVLIVSSVAAVDLKIDPSVVLATRSYVEIYAAPKVHTHAPGEILPGGLVGQVLRKKSNTAGDVEWADPTEGVRVNVNTVEESQVLVAGQTVVNLLKVTTNGMVLHIGGARTDKDIDFAITTISSFKLTKSYPKGTRVTISQNETAGVVANPLDAGKNLADVADPAAARKNLGAAPALAGVPLKWPTMDCPSWALVRDGGAYPRTSYAVLFAILAPLRTCTISVNAAGAIVSGLSRTSDLWVGMPCENDTLPAGTTVKSIDSASQVTLSANATVTTANALARFFLHGYGNGGGATTFGVMDDRGLFERNVDQARGYEVTSLVGTTTAGQNTVTGMPSTRGLYVGMPLSSVSGIPAGLTVASISSGGSITMSGNASVSGARMIIFTGGQVGNERGDTMQGHNHQWAFFSNGTAGGSGYLGESGGSAVLPNTVRDALPDNYGNGTPRVGPETRPRFRNYLPIIVY